MLGSLPVINLDKAKFECIFGRGCDGICCQHGKPPLSDDDRARIDPYLDKFLSELRPAARALIDLFKRGRVVRRILFVLCCSAGWVQRHALHFFLGQARSQDAAGQLHP